MDDSVLGTKFDENGECNYCKQHDAFTAQYPVGSIGKLLDKLPKRVVVGVSGGRDSSYMLHKVVEAGLEPVAVTYDNHWGTGIAAKNVETMTDALDVPLITIKPNQRIYDDILLSFMKAGVPDIEAVSDISFIASLYREASRRGIKHVLIGSSFRTEGITPHGMFYFDAKYVESVHKAHGKYPEHTNQIDMLRLKPWLKWITVDRIKRVFPLYYDDYKLESAQELLESGYGWEWYGGHHRENVFTEFCNNYWLYHRYGIDLRKVEYSALVRSHQMDRDDAIEELASPPLVGRDTIPLVKNRFHLTDTEFDDLLYAPHVNRDEYENYKPTFRKMRPFFWAASQFDLVPKTFYEKYCK